MVKTKNKKIKKIIQEYIQLLSKEIKIDKVILFGSYAGTKHRKGSDIDLAVVSPNFKDKNHIKNMQFLSLKTIGFAWPPLEVLPYTPEEYKNCDSRSLLAEIKRTGKLIFRAS